MVLADDAVGGRNNCTLLSALQAQPQPQLVQAREQLSFLLPSCRLT